MGCLCVSCQVAKAVAANLEVDPMMLQFFKGQA